MSGSSRFAVHAGRAAWAVASLVLATAAQAGVVSAAIEGHALVARGADGRMLWRYWLPVGSAAQTAVRDADGSMRLSDGTRIDRDGRLQSRTASASVKATVSRPAWDAPVELGVANDNVNGPAFDAQGNGYALAYRYDFASPNQVPIYVYRSTGASSIWTQLPPLSAQVATAFRPIITVDSAGDITAVYRDYDSYELLAERYTPAGGWQTPVTLYPGAEFMQEFASAVDAAGNVTVLAGIGSGDTLTLMSYRYSAASGQWQAPETIAANVNADASQPIVLNRSPDMTQLLAAYTTVGTTQGVTLQKYLASSTAWSAPEPVPNSEAAATKFALPVIATTIDNSARATVITPFATSGARWSLWALREPAQASSQRWASHMLLDWRSAAGTQVTSLGAIVDARGTVLTGLNHQEGDPNAYDVSVFRFTSAGGWSNTTIGSYSVTSGGAYGSVAAPLAWVGTSGQAVAIYTQVVGGSHGVPASSIGAGSTWHRLPFPGKEPGPIGTNAAGDVLLLNATSDDVSALWLRPD